MTTSFQFMLCHHISSSDSLVFLFHLVHMDKTEYFPHLKNSINHILRKHFSCSIMFIDTRILMSTAWTWGLFLTFHKTTIQMYFKCIYHSYSPIKQPLHSLIHSHECIMFTNYHAINYNIYFFTSKLTKQVY